MRCPVSTAFKKSAPKKPIVLHYCHDPHKFNYITYIQSVSFCITKIDASFKWTGNTLCLSLKLLWYEFVEITNIYSWISLQHREQYLICFYFNFDISFAYLSVLYSWEKHTITLQFWHLEKFSLSPPSS